jgi:putative serine protease PepD
MPRSFSRGAVAAFVAAAAIAGVGAGAAIYAAAAGNDSGSAATPTASAATPVASSSQLTVGEVYRDASKGVVEITVTQNGGGGQQTFPYGQGEKAQAQGSGFVYDTSGHVLTNQHVVANASNIRVTFSNGSTYSATVVGTDPSTDIAVLKVDAPANELHPLTLGNSSALRVGDGAVAIGAPFGLDETVTSGIVSAIGREINAPDGSTITDAIQTDAAINHGNSGGPLLDLHGKVVGISSQIESDSGGNDGVGFAVPSNTVKRVATALIASGKVSHAQLGVRVQTITPAAASTIGEAAGVAVVDVQPGSAAADAGLKASTGTKSVNGQSYPTDGDVITEVDGQNVETSADLKAAIDAHAPGDTIKLTVVRSGDTRTVTVTLDARS